MRRCIGKYKFRAIKRESKCFKGDFQELIEFKCLRCGYEKEEDADIVFECMEMGDGKYPVCYCQKCNKDSMIPKDIYEQVKEEKSKKKKK